MKYEKWLQEWLDNYVQPATKLRTFTRYNEIVRQHINPNLGIYELSELSPLIIQRYITNLLKCGNLLTGKPLSSNSVNAIITVIKSSLKMAYILGYTSLYEGDKIKRPRQIEKKVKCFSLPEQRKIEKFILSDNKRKYLGVILCLYTGLRIGELLALEWNDIDFLNKELCVNKSCHYGKDSKGKYTRMITTPKTSSSERVIPLTEQLFSYFLIEKEISDSIYVVTNNNKPISVRSYQRCFKLLLKRLSINHLGFHSLRHTFATRALECGMDVKSLSEILGHKSPTVTLNRYVHSFSEHKRAMMNNVGKLLS